MIKTKKSLSLVLASFLLCVATARAQRLSIPGSIVDPTAVDPVKLLPDYPAAGSEEARDELKLMLMMQEHRIQADLDRCRSEASLSPLGAFRSVMGPWFTSANLPHLTKFMKQAVQDIKPVVNEAKDHFKRPRPASDNPKIQVAVKPDPSYSYPSGHATLGMMYALILAELAPDRRNALLERGREIGWDRVIAGEHHPSDIYAGRVLGQALAESLLADPKVQAELPALKQELADAVRGAAHETAQPAGAPR